jgi:hypothetical protein
MILLKANPLIRITIPRVTVVYIYMPSLRLIVHNLPVGILYHFFPLRLT